MQTIATQGPLDRSGRLLHEGDPTAQLALAVANVGEVLSEAGLGWADVVQLRIRTTDRVGLLDDWDTLADHLRTEGARPATTVVEVPRLPLPGMTVCIDAVAAPPTTSPQPTTNPPKEPR